MQDIFAARIMTTDLHTVSPETLVEDAANEMLANEIGSVVVVDEEHQPQGILTTTDFVRIVAERKPKDETPVSAYMSESVLTGSAQDSIREVADRLVTYGIHHLPIVDETEGLIGMVTTTDLAAYLADVEAPTAV
ncbi:CBS domain-containing protein [Salinirubellus salinus]|uniref:CBS domain-containing protein n=1 Tax=Salinirubellus salinus TaxID=1364945 RepID=A0A9E7R1Z0_9EURY|nr:CBS domain-containing protein [Salinirubellus salinus]UWM54275.1 CBS domain-containing protein [Salinirubellus salinus]